MITILIPCYEEDKIIERSIQENYEILVKHPIIIVDKKGGDKFLFLNQQGNMNIQYFTQNTSFWFARRFGLEFVKTKYVLNLDVDTVLPKGYIEQAIAILEARPEVGAVTAEYAEPFNNNHHLGFGNSVWRTEQLKELYDWRLTTKQPSMCECNHMWDKLMKKELKVETLPMEAIHLKGQTLHRNIYKEEQHYNSGDTK
jgi:glycosyltransferase involved in cell wall biosynthesis